MKKTNMRSTLLVLMITLTGCTSTSFEELGKQLDTAIKGNQNSHVVQDRRHSLTINASPSGSTIKIMNIKPKYHHGIRLAAGSYDVLVQKKGYESYRTWVNLSGRDVNKSVTLQALGQNTAFASPPTTTQKSGKAASVVDVSQPTQPEKPAKQKNVSEPVSQRETQAKPKPTVNADMTKTSPVIKDIKKPNQNKPSNEKRRSDYRPPEISTPSELIASEMTEDEQPKFNGAYIKTVDEGFFSDTVQLVEMEQKPAYTAKLFRMKPRSDISITWLLKQKKKYFAPEELGGTVTISVDAFNGIIFKGKSAEYVTLHRAERWVQGYDENGGKIGAMAKFFDSNYNVPEGGAAYVPMDEEKSNKSKISDDSYFVDFKQTPEKGLYICWVGSHFWFFNLI